MLNYYAGILGILLAAGGVVELSQLRWHQKYSVMSISCKRYEPCTATVVATIECRMRSRESCFKQCTDLASSTGRNYFCSVER